jgi:hypothetical protein
VSPEHRAWNLVAVGLRLKLLALAAAAGLPALAAGLWLTDYDLRGVLAGAAAAAVPDFIGRCLCLAAPAGRLAAALSVVFQLAAFTALALFGYTGGWFEIAVGVVVAGGLQLAAAAFFVRFLRVAGDALGRPDVATRADVLGWLLMHSVFAASGLGVVAVVLTVVVYVVGILTCGLGFYFGPPIAGAVLVPLAVATVGGLAAVEWAYVTALLRLTRAIRAAG